MSSLELPNRGLIIVIIEASVCLLLNIISFLGNALVCLAVYKNPKLRSTINMYIIALAVSDLLCAVHWKCLWRQPCLYWANGISEFHYAKLKVLWMRSLRT